jgi:hypothetical protein
MYDVQYDVVAYGSKTNWMFVFVNHKWVTCVLNALIFTLLGVHFKKCVALLICFLKLNIYVFSSRFKNFRIKKNDISSFSFKYFKDWIFFRLCMEVLLWKWIIFIYLKWFKFFCFMHEK